MPNPTQTKPPEQDQIKAAVAGADPSTDPTQTPLPEQGLPPSETPSQTQPPIPGTPPENSLAIPTPSADLAMPQQADPAAAQTDPYTQAQPTDPNLPQAPLTAPQQEPTEPLPEQGLPELPPEQPQNQIQSMSGMQPSLMDGPEIPPEQQADPYTQAPQAPQEYYDPYASSANTNADAISEVAEQIVAEKLSPIRRAVEDTLDHRTTVEAKLTHLNERLKRIENIIDELQLSILQKVGQYVSDVSDLKKELIETQKSFKTVNKRNRKK